MQSPSNADDEFEYDVAFSFMAADEPIAQQLVDLLQERFKTFIYSKRQGELAGTDGENTFHAVFGEKARNVVVLHREGWGKTPWTRIEETAIKNRAYNNGYGFAVFVPLDEKPALPAYVPKTYIWLDYRRFGPSATAAVISNQLQRAGALGRIETSADRAKRLLRELDAEKRRQALHRTEAGVRAATTSFESIAEALKRSVEQGALRGIATVAKQNAQNLLLVGQGTGFKLEWHYYAANILDDAELVAELWDKHPPWSGAIFPYDEPRSIGRRPFTPDFDANDAAVWKECGILDRVHYGDALAEDLAIWFMNKIYKRSLAKR